MTPLTGASGIVESADPAGVVVATTGADEEYGRDADCERAPAPVLLHDCSFAEPITVGGGGRRATSGPILLG